MKLSTKLTQALLAVALIIGGPRVAICRADECQQPATSGEELRAGKLMPDASGMIHFDTAFNAMSKEIHATIIAEGIPLHHRLSKQQSDEVLKSFPVVTPQERLNQLALDFDYNVDYKLPHVILLRKRYTDPSDLPCVTYAEIVHALRTVDTTISPFDNGSAMWATSPVGTFFNSLSEDQKKQAAIGVAFEDLTAEQRDLASSAVRYIQFYGKMHSLRELLWQLQLLDNKRTAFGWVTIGGIATFGFVGPFGLDGYIWKVPLNAGFVSQIDRAMIIPSNRPADLLVSTDPTLLTSEDRKIADEAAEIPVSNALTIGAAIDGKANDSKGVRVSIDDDVAKKQICLFGSDQCSLIELVEASTDLYGLGLLVPNSNEYKMTWPIPHSAHSLEDIPNEIRRIWPLPLQRSLASQSNVGIDAHDSRIAASAATRQPTTPEEMQAAFEEKNARREAAGKASDAYYFPSVRRLLALTMPRVPKPTDRAVPVSDYPEETKRLIAICRLSGPPLSNLESLLDLDTAFASPDMSAVHFRMSKKRHVIMTSVGDDKTYENAQLIWDP